MKSERLSKILKNDYVQTIILAAILFGGVFAFWFGLRFAFRTEFPLLAVASGSMEPSLYRGDLIVVEGLLEFSELHVGLYKFPNGTLNPTPGEVIVYYDPRYGKDLYHLIVHRAVEKRLENGMWYFETKGDASGGPFPDPWGPIRQDDIVGKVVGIVPWIGHVPLFMHENRIAAALIIVFLFAVVIIVDFIFPKKGDEKTEGKEEKLLNNRHNSFHNRIF